MIKDVCKDFFCSATFFESAPFIPYINGPILLSARAPLRTQLYGGVAERLKAAVC